MLFGTQCGLRRCGTCRCPMVCYMYMYMYMYIQSCTCTCIYIVYGTMYGVYVCTQCFYVCVCVHVCVCVCVCMCVCVCVCVCSCVYTYKCIYIMSVCSVHVLIYMCIYTHMHVQYILSPSEWVERCRNLFLLHPDFHNPLQQPHSHQSHHHCGGLIHTSWHTSVLSVHCDVHVGTRCPKTIEYSYRHGKHVFEIDAVYMYIESQREREREGEREGEGDNYCPFMSTLPVIKSQYFCKKCRCCDYMCILM